MLIIRHCFTERYRNCCHIAAAKCTTEIIRIRNFLLRLFLHSIKPGVLLVTLRLAVRALHICEILSMKMTQWDYIQKRHKHFSDHLVEGKINELTWKAYFSSCQSAVFFIPPCALLHFLTQWTCDRQTGRSGI